MKKKYTLSVVRVKPGEHKNRKGMFYPDINRVIIYTAAITDKDDYNVTFMHELYHAYDLGLNETDTERLALYTNAEYPELVDFARSVFL